MIKFEGEFDRRVHYVLGDDVDGLDGRETGYFVLESFDQYRPGGLQFVRN